MAMTIPLCNLAFFIVSSPFFVMRIGPISQAPTMTLEIGQKGRPRVKDWILDPPTASNFPAAEPPPSRKKTAFPVLFGHNLREGDRV